MKTIQRILKFFHQHLFCWHDWKHLKWYGCPNEPDLIQCKKCGYITELF